MDVVRSHRALIADDEEGLRFVLGKLLRREGCQVDEATDGESAVKLASENLYDLYILDLKMPRMDGMTAMRRILEMQPDALVVIMTAFGSQNLALEAMGAGAYDYFTKPFEMEELRVILRRALEKKALLSKLATLERTLDERRSGHRIIGNGEKMKHVFEMIRRVTGHDVTVLIAGESGVGKELVAEAIHNGGPGPDKPFVRVNCAAIPEPLLESELFGHEKGAFTGAYNSKPGKFELADGGSILLDEIGEMPLSLQAKLLRVLQEKRVERIGDTKTLPIDVRIMAATNRDLSQMVREKTFREDLFFRVNVISIVVPPLRERVEDIAPLVLHFLGKYAGRSGKRITRISSEAMELMESCAWPGNVRELENAIQRAIVMTSGSVIEASALPASVVGSRGDDGGAAKLGAAAARAIEEANEEIFGSLAETIDRIVEREEKRIILAALRKMDGKRQETADALGISRKSLHNKMTKYGMLKSRE
jgi:DNA-binding NtrC family response regulator